MADINNGAMTPTDRLNHASAIGASKKRGLPGGGSSHIVNPLYGHIESSAEIMSAAGLGRRPPKAKTKGEKMSDADEPTQDVKVENGKTTHRKASQNGGVREIPIGTQYDQGPLDDYPNLNHAPMPTTLDDLQSRLGY